MPAQQAPQPITTRGRGRGGANIVIKRGGRQSTPPPQNPQQTTKKVTFQQPAQVIVKSEPEQAKVEPNPFLQPHLPEIHEMTEETGRNRFRTICHRKSWMNFKIS